MHFDRLKPYPPNVWKEDREYRRQDIAVWPADAPLEKCREDIQLPEENVPPLEEVQPLQEPGVVAPECAPISLGMPPQPMLEPGGVFPDHEPTPIPLGMLGPEAPKHQYPSQAGRPTDFYGEYVTH